MCRVIVGLLSAVLVAGLASPAAAQAATGTTSTMGVAQPGGTDVVACGLVTVEVPSLQAQRYQVGGENSVQAKAQRRLGRYGISLFGGPVVLRPRPHGDVGCGDAARLLREAFGHPGRGGGLLGQPQGWSCRFLGVKLDPSQSVGEHVWNDAATDALCTGGSASTYLETYVVATPPVPGGRDSLPSPLDQLQTAAAGASGGGQAARLPKGGRRPYEPPKGTHGQPQRIRGGGFKDKYGNRWKWDPQKREWDVQHPDESHTNVSPEGRITHKDDNFPNRPPQETDEDDGTDTAKSVAVGVAGGAAAAGALWWAAKLLSPACGPALPVCAVVL